MALRRLLVRELEIGEGCLWMEQVMNSHRVIGPSNAHDLVKSRKR